MAKQFYTTGEGSSQTLSQINNETIKIYPTEADLDADLANLEENEIVATNEDNMHVVTSNAVAKAIGNFYPSGSYSFIDNSAKMILPAYISSSSTTLVFMLPIIHESGKTVNFTNIGLACHLGSGGYVEDSGATKINMTDYNFAFTDRGRFGITVTVTKKDGTAWIDDERTATVVNNTACTVVINQIEFTVSQ